MNVWKHAHADHATVATFWQNWLAQLEDVFISRVASGVVGVLQRLQPCLLMSAKESFSERTNAFRPTLNPK
jgi:hypothetical protein